MFQNKTPKIGIPGGLALSALVSTVITLVGAGIFSWLIVSGAIGEGSTSLGGHLVQFVASAAGALTATLTIKKMRLQICLLSGSVYCVILLGITALCFDGTYSSIGMSSLSILLGCGAVAFLPFKNKSNKGTRRNRKRRFVQLAH